MSAQPRSRHGSRVVRRAHAQDDQAVGTVDSAAPRIVALHDVGEIAQSIGLLLEVGEKASGLHAAQRAEPKRAASDWSGTYRQCGRCSAA